MAPSTLRWNGEDDTCAAISTVMCPSFYHAKCLPAPVKYFLSRTLFASTRPVLSMPHIVSKPPSSTFYAAHCFQALVQYFLCRTLFPSPRPVLSMTHIVCKPPSSTFITHIVCKPPYSTFYHAHCLQAPVQYFLSRILFASPSLLFSNSRFKTGFEF
jgi:hypothetical protein